MNQNYVVMHSKNSSAYEMSQNIEQLMRSLTKEQMKALAYVEGALEFGTAETAQKEFSRLDMSTQKSIQGIEISRRIAERLDDDLWWKRVNKAMQDNLGGKTKMSKSGNVIIFAQEQYGRHDLSSMRNHAQFQLDSAGIEIDMSYFHDDSLLETPKEASSTGERTFDGREVVTKCLDIEIKSRGPSGIIEKFTAKMLKHPNPWNREEERLYNLTCEMPCDIDSLYVINGTDNETKIIAHYMKYRDDGRPD